MEYASIYDLKSYVAFFLSKFDGLVNLAAFGHRTVTGFMDEFNGIIDPENLENSYIKQRRDEFDVFFDNGRVGRAGREPTKQVSHMYEMWNGIEYDEMFSNIMIIWNRGDETPLTVIYGTVRDGRIVDLRGGDVSNKPTLITNYGEKGRHTLRNEFWAEFMSRFNKVSNIYRGRKIEDHGSSWFTAKSGIPDIRYCFTTSGNYVAVELSMSKTYDKKYNKKVYDFLYQYKNQIEKKFGDKLLWERLDNKIMSRISYRLEGVNVYDRNQWEEIMEFLSKSMIKFDNALKEYIELFNKR